MHIEIPNLENYRTEITTHAATLVHLVREYSELQSTLWLQVPRLALAADGIMGYNDNYSKAYAYKLWPLLHNGTKYTCYVDLRNGQFVEQRGFYGVVNIGEEEVSISSGDIIADRHPACDVEVLRLAGSIDLINARNILRSLAVEALRPYPQYYESCKQIRIRNIEAGKFNIHLPSEEELLQWAQDS